MPVYNKLVRDKIPEISTANNERHTTRILDDVEYRAELQKKLQEEVAEFIADNDIEELADILEVVYALAAMLGTNPVELEIARTKKAAERGGFAKRIFLVESQPL